MNAKRVAVIAGGVSAERDISLLSGACVLDGFKALGWPALALDLVADGRPPKDGAKGFRKVPVSRLVRALSAFRPDVVFLALHGTGGEDGRIQGMLDLAGFRYTGSGTAASALAMDKVVSKKVFERDGVPTPAWGVAVPGAPCPVKGGWPVVVKPSLQGSAVGVSLAHNRAEYAKAVAAAARFEGAVLVERFIPGREFTVGVLGGAALPVVEIIPKNEFYDWESKYTTGGSRHVCPAEIPAAAARRAQVLALAAHQSLGCSGYSRVDLRMDPQGGMFVLEVNTLPGMTRMSLMPDAARAAGLSFEKLLAAMVGESLKRRA